MQRLSAKVAKRTNFLTAVVQLYNVPQHIAITPSQDQPGSHIIIMPPLGFAGRPLTQQPTNEKQLPQAPWVIALFNDM